MNKTSKGKDREGKWELQKQYGRDMHGSPFYEAICPHGIGHHKGIHGCDGCCQVAPKVIWDKVSSDVEQTAVSSKGAGIKR